MSPWIAKWPHYIPVILKGLLSYSLSISYKLGASCTETLPVGTFKTFAFSVLFAYYIEIISFSLICFAGYAWVPLTEILPMSETSFATVLRFINLETFKFLSNLMHLSYHIFWFYDIFCSREIVKFYEKVITTIV